MGLMEIAVGAIVGAAVGWPGLYLQRRMNRKEELHSRVMQSATMAWEAAHETERAVDALVRQDKGLAQDFFEQVNRLGETLHAHSMIMWSREEFGMRIYTCGRILRYMSLNNHVPDEELIKMARYVIHDAQWVCATYLIGRQIPSEPSYLLEYESIVCTD